jgi:hypothetical protein
MRIEYTGLSEIKGSLSRWKVFPSLYDEMAEITQSTAAAVTAAVITIEATGSS